jgi:hypothetical protein
MNSRIETFQNTSEEEPLPFPPPADKGKKLPNGCFSCEEYLCSLMSLTVVIDLLLRHLEIVKLLLT